MLPFIKDERVIVPDRSTASTLINKGDYGTPTKGGGLELSILEAAYLVSCGRLEVKTSSRGKKASVDHLVKRGMDSRRRFVENYLVFRDIRERGVNIQSDGGNSFISYPRGQGPGRGRADTWIRTYREHDSVTAGDLFSRAKRREGMRMGLTAAIVDGDFDITYYSVAVALRDSTLPPEPGSGWSGLRDVREVPGGGSIIFGSETNEGSDIGFGRALSMEESSYLIGRLPDGRMERLRELVYRDLRSRGFLVRTGFKYGSHFRVYSSGSMDDHSDLLVHCAYRDVGMTWEELSRAIRLSNSVRKKMLFAFEKNGMVSYLRLSWTRP